MGVGSGGGGEENERRKEKKKEGLCHRTLEDKERGAEAAVITNEDSGNWPLTARTHV